MTLRNNAEKIHDLDILDEIEKNPNATQATMANQMNVAIGTVNWHLKRLYIEKFNGWEKIDLAHSDYNGKIWWDESFTASLEGEEKQ